MGVCAHADRRCATGAFAQQQNEPLPVLVFDARGAFDAEADAATAESLGVTADDLPTHAFGVVGGLHVYPLRRGGFAFGVGGELLLSRAHKQKNEEDGITPLGPEVTGWFRSLSGQLSFNFGHRHGWSYLSGGIGPVTSTRISTTRPTDSSRRRSTSAPVRAGSTPITSPSAWTCASTRPSPPTPRSSSANASESPLDGVCSRRHLAQVIGSRRPGLMVRETLLDFFEDFASSDDTFIVHDDGYRVREVTYRRTGRGGPRFCRPAGRGGHRGRRQGRHLVGEPRRMADRVLGLRPGRCGRRARRLPASEDLLHRIADIVRAKAILVGDEVKVHRAADTPVWNLEELETGPRPGLRPQSARASQARGQEPAPDRLLPRRDHLHLGRDRRSERRDDHASQHPRERHADRARDREVPEVREAVPSDSVPEPAAAQPHVRPVDGDVRAADAPRHGRVLARLQPGGDPPSDQVAAHLGAGLRAESARRAARARAARAAGDGRARSAQPQALGLALVALPRGASPVRLEVLVHRLRRRAARSRARGLLAQARIPRRAGLRPHRNRAHRHAEPSVPRLARNGRHAHWRRGSEDRGRRGDPRARRERHAGVLQRRSRATDRSARDCAAAESARLSRTAGSTPATSASSMPRGGCSSRAARRK